MTSFLPLLVGIMASVCSIPGVEGDVVAVVKGMGICVRFRVVPGGPEIEFPEWTENYFSAEELSKYKMEPRNILSETKECHLEGPLNSFNDYDSCWRFYSYRNLLETVKAAIEFVGLDDSTESQLIAVPLVGKTYILRLVKVDDGNDGSELVVKSITPIPSDPVEGLPPRSNEKARLVHGVSPTWCPRTGNSWHALDLHVNGCTDESLYQILNNMKRFSSISEFVIWGIDNVPSENFLRIISVSENVEGFGVTFVASSLSQVDGKLVEKIGLENTAVSAVKTHFESPKISDKQNITIPDVSLVTPEALRITETYFVLPLVHPKLAQPFVNVVPHLDSPKVLIYGPPQSGKSTLANWMIAKVLNGSPVDVSVFTVNSSSLFSKYLGSSEKRIMKLFKKAEIASPSIILIEGIHSLCPSRYSQEDDGETGVGDTYDRMVATFLNCLDGIDTGERKVSVIATSLLEPEKLDPAAVRPGRLETHIFCPPIH